MISRRRFLQSSSSLAAAGALPGILIARDSGAATRPTTLISIHLAGGNDTLNAVVPYTDPEYYRVRGSLAIGKRHTRALDERVGFNLGLAQFVDLFERKKLSIIHGVGYPSFNYSHFEASKIYATADPTRALTTGWLGRALDVATAAQTASGGQTSALTGASIGGPASDLNAASFITPTLPQDPETYAVSAKGTPQRQALASIVAQPTVVGASSAFNTIARGGQSAWKTVATVAEASQLTSSITYPGSDFAARLKFIAQLLRSDETIRVIALSQGNYDTHENQRPRQEAQLAELSGGVSAFMDDLYAHGLSGRVAVLLWSEFSRRVMSNGTGGTDHGSAQALMLLGDGVRGGFLGHLPILSDPDDVSGGNITVQVDFRQVYATLLDGWLGLDSKKILGRSWETLPILL